MNEAGTEGDDGTPPGRYGRYGRSRHGDGVQQLQELVRRYRRLHVEEGRVDVGGYDVDLPHGETREDVPQEGVDLGDGDGPGGDTREVGGS